MDEEKIIELMRTGDTQGLEALIEKYQRLAYSIALSILGRDSQEDVQECVNSAFYDVWLSMPGYDGQLSSLKGWVALVTRRRAIDQLRKNICRGKASAGDFSEVELSLADPCAQLIEREGIIHLFNQFVQRLPEPDKSIFVRRFFALESIPDIARRYSMTRGAVDSRLSRMRKSLKETLKGVCYDEGERHNKFV